MLPELKFAVSKRDQPFHYQKLTKTMAHARNSGVRAHNGTQPSLGITGCCPNITRGQEVLPWRSCTLFQKPSAAVLEEDGVLFYCTAARAAKDKRSTKWEGLLPPFASFC